MLGLLFLFISFWDFFGDENYDKDGDNSDPENINYLNHDRNKEKDKNDYKTPSSDINKDFYNLLNDDEWFKYANDYYKLKKLENELKNNFKINSSGNLESFINANFYELVDFYKNICNLETYQAEKLLLEILNVFGKNKINDFQRKKSHNTRSL